MLSPTHRFYVFRATEPRVAPVMPPGVTCRIWEPSWTRVPPPAIRNVVHWVWWLFHNLGIFANRDFGVAMVERDGRLLHRSGVFPRFFRFPFMSPVDLQLGDTWTDPASRGQGLAGLAISAVLASRGRSGRRFWYIVEDDNIASIRVIEKAGFTLSGRGGRFPRLGIGAIGYYSSTLAHSDGNLPPTTRPSI